MSRRWILFACCFTVAVVVGRLSTLGQGHLALIWPAAGVAVAWLVRAHARRQTALALLTVGVVAAVGNGLTGVPFPASVLFAAANMVMAYVARLLLSWPVGSRHSRTFVIDRLTSFHHFLAGSAIAVAAGTVVGMAGVVSAGWPVGWDVGTSWWLRNVTGVVVIAGPWLAAPSALSRWRVRQLAEGGAFLVGAVGLTVFVFSPGQELPLLFLPIALLAWAAVRLPVQVSALISLLTCGVALLRGGGPVDALAQPGVAGVVTQGFALVSVVLTLLIATVRQELVGTLRELTAAKLRAQEATADLLTLVQAVPVGLFLLEDDGRIKAHNTAASRWIHRGDSAPLVDEVLHKTTLDGRNVPAAERPSVRALAGQSTLAARLVAEDLDGDLRVVSVDAVPLQRREDGRVGGAVLVIDDITDEHAVLESLSRERERTNQLISDAPHGIAVVNANGVLTRVNAALAEMVDADAATLVGTPVAHLLVEHPDLATALLSATLEANGQRVESQWQMADRAGLTRFLALTSRSLSTPSGTEVIINMTDVTEQRSYEQRLAHLAAHDVLTGLPNRRSFEQSLAQHQNLCDRYGPKGSLLLIDLDRFKEVNDSLGHAAGDELITSIAGVLISSLRTSDTVARLGGDEFAVLLPDTDGAAAVSVADSLAARVRDHCRELAGSQRRVTASIGVVSFAMASEHQTDPLQLADMLMYDAKDAGRDGVAGLTCREDRPPRLGARVHWEDQIEDALEIGAFELHLQPILDLRTGRVTRAEALVRMWMGDTLVPPAQFVYVAERSGQAAALDSWVIRNAARTLAVLQRWDPGFTLTVNVSGSSIGHAAIEQVLRDATAEHGVDPQHIIVEVTETAAVGNMPLARDFGERLHRLGTQFALDDFGAGYGSFYYLKHLVFDYVKIDGEFVRDAAGSLENTRMLSAIVDVAKRLEKQSVAEFVVDDATLRLVQHLGVDYAQGYHIGMPIPLAEFVTEHIALGGHHDIIPAAG